jgi:Protein of unknown function (DUF2934)
MTETVQDRIRQRAYHLWNNGSRQGDETYFWLMAEREIQAEMEAEKDTPEFLKTESAKEADFKTVRKPRAVKSAAKTSKPAAKTSVKVESAVSKARTRRAAKQTVQV